MGQQDLKIHELLSRIKHGEIRLPEMQRQYVWRATRVRDLLDSLYRGYPSGTILTWEPGAGVATRGFSVELGEVVQNRYQLLLDGQQRLTSLYAVMHDKPLQVRGRKRPIDILFNLEHPDDLQIITEVNENNDIDDDALNGEISEASDDELLTRFEKMAFVVHTQKLAKLPHWISVTEVFKGNSDAPFLTKAGVTLVDDARYSKYSKRLENLRGIENYEYRVNILDREKSYEEVTEIFVRVNSLGAKLKSSDLALAQITAKWPNSLKEFQKFEKECKESGFDLDLSIHLRNLLVFSTGQSHFHMVNSRTVKELQDGWKLAQKGMQFALNFLKANVGIDSPILLSSPFLAITIAYYAYHQNYSLSPIKEKKLRRWVLTSNAKGHYSRGSSETILDQDLTAIKKAKEDVLETLLQLLKTQTGRLKVLPEDLENRDRRSAYFKTMFLAFRKDEAKDWWSQLTISLRHDGVHSLNFHHIFPKAILKDREPTRKVNDICNLAFIDGRTNRKLGYKEPADYLPKIIDEIGGDELRKQCIPDAPDLWKLDAYDQFIEERRRIVAERLNDFLGNNEQDGD